MYTIVMSNYNGDRDKDKLFTLEDFVRNFPFPEIRQLEVLKEICNVINEGLKFFILEAPTGFGKSTIAFSMAKTLESSYNSSKSFFLQTIHSEHES